MKRVIHLSGILIVSLHTLIILDRAWDLKLLLMDQHIHEPLPVCKTSVFISLWSTAKGPEKKAISSQPWIEYLVSVTLPHTFGPAGLDTVLYVYKSMKGEIFQHAQCIPAPFCRRLGKALCRFQEMPHKHLQQIHDPLSKKSVDGPVASHSIAMHFSLQKIPFYLTTLLASFACKSYGLTKQNHSTRAQSAKSLRIAK